MMRSFAAHIGFNRCYYYNVYLYLKILLTETGIWAFVSDKKKSLKAGRLKFMQVIRRVIRFSGKSTFLYRFIYFHYL